MRLVNDFQEPAFRVHVPRWAYAPTSGDGAGDHGGRLNRIGLPALYLALDDVTALAEFQQRSALMPPSLMVSYRILLRQLVDFRDGYNHEWDPLWQELTCDWRRLWFNGNIEPPSWMLGDLALEAGAVGILFPSMANPGGTNLVVYTEALDRDDRLEAYDPHGDLPKNSLSWE